MSDPMLASGFTKNHQGMFYALYGILNMGEDMKTDNKEDTLY